MMNKVQDNPLNYEACSILDGELYTIVRFEDSEDCRRIIPKPERTELMRLHHDEPLATYIGIYKTHHSITQKYYWPKMKNDFRRYISRCEICLKAKPIHDDLTHFWGEESCL